MKLTLEKGSSDTFCVWRVLDFLFSVAMIHNLMKHISSYCSIFQCGVDLKLQFVNFEPKFPLHCKRYVEWYSITSNLVRHEKWLFSRFFRTKFEFRGFRDFKIQLIYLPHPKLWWKSTYIDVLNFQEQLFVVCTD